MRSKRYLRYASLVLAVLVSLVIALSIPAQGTSPGHGQGKTAISSESTTTQSCFSSGSTATFFKVCVSDHGNVLSIEAPSGNTIKGGTLEGYELCDVSGVHGYDAGTGSESGFGAATITQPGGANTFPLTITRDTTDGMYRLTQTFARDKAERDFTITMTVKNQSGSTAFGVRLVRYFDADIDGDASDDVYDDSVDSVWGRDVVSGVSGHGLSLTELTLGVSHQSYVSTFASLTSQLNTCGVLSTSGPTAQGNFGGVIFYDIGTIAAGAKKNVKVVYRVF